MSLLLAVDGGNSKTEAVVFTEAGALLQHVHGPGSGGGPAHVRQVLASMIDESARTAIGTAVLALAGLDFPEDAAAYRAALEPLFPGAAMMIENDAAALLDLREHDSDAVVAVIVSGAGLNAVARGPRGLATVPALGWLSGDFGGGDEVARRAIAAAYRAADGRGPATRLQHAVLESLDAPDHRTLALLLRDKRRTPEAVSALAATVAALAAHGDAVARQLIDAAADEAIGLLVTVVREAGGASDTNADTDDADAAEEGTTAVAIELAGGMFRDPGFRGHVERAIRDRGWTIHEAHGRPIAGAVRRVCQERFGRSATATDAAERVLAPLQNELTEKAETE